VPTQIVVESIHETSPGDFPLVTDIAAMLRKCAPRTATTLTVKFCRHEVGDLAFRARKIENFGDRAVWIPKQFSGGLDDLTPADLLTILVLNAAMEVRGIKTQEFAESLRFWNSYQQDESLFCISVVLPALPAISRQPQPMRSG